MKEIRAEKENKQSPDYLSTKDAYDGQLDCHRGNTPKTEKPRQEESLPESSRPRKDGPGGE